ncbi:MAG TPA: sulfatase-like hydrolase/transferase, partial [Thermoanaerobaculia bacterium]|nr:sulfatase-like hydrolase/transferase [Thermoanaerobaculia bacterium]
MPIARVAASILTGVVLAFGLGGCGADEAASPQPPRSILLVTLDTTRADSIGPEAKGVSTPGFDAIAERGLRFRQAYAPAPQTLPSHGSMMTGVYPAAHGVHENARVLDDRHELLAERLRAAGYRTAAFVSAFPLARRFGLARGFELYDDDLGEDRTERSARETTDRVLAFLDDASDEPLFLWVHYFDPHYPYEPPEPFGSRYPDDPYRGEIAAMDEQLGRLAAVFEARYGDDAAILVVGDHGESRGDHGEAQHGHLIYQGAMHVPLVLAGPGVEPGVSDSAVSIRRVFHTLLDWAGLGSENTLRDGAPEIVLGEGMIPFLHYGWQPQVMAIEGRQKVILAGDLEVFDVVADPGETTDLAATAVLSRALRRALREYPIPSPDAPAADALSEDEKKQLASLGYVASEARPPVRPDAPPPREMAHLFDSLEAASDLFMRGEYAAAVPLLEAILAEDAENLMVALRLAAAHSALGRNERALAAFRRAEAIAPRSVDVRHYLGLHYFRTGEWERAAPLLEESLADSPSRLPALEALARIRQREG